MLTSVKKGEGGKQIAEKGRAGEVQTPPTSNNIRPSKPTFVVRGGTFGM